MNDGIRPMVDKVQVPLTDGQTAAIGANYWTEADILKVHGEITTWIVDTVNYLNQKLWWPPPGRVLFHQFLAMARARN